MQFWMASSNFCIKAACFPDTDSFTPAVLDTSACTNACASTAVAKRNTVAKYLTCAAELSISICCRVGDRRYCITFTYAAMPDAPVGLLVLFGKSFDRGGHVGHFALVPDGQFMYHSRQGKSRVRRCSVDCGNFNDLRFANAGCQMAQLSTFIGTKNAAIITMPAISHNSTVNMNTMGIKTPSLPAKIQSSSGVNSGTQPLVQNIRNTISILVYVG